MTRTGSLLLKVSILSRPVAARWSLTESPPPATSWADTMNCREGREDTLLPSQ